MFQQIFISFTDPSVPNSTNRRMVRLDEIPEVTPDNKIVIKSTGLVLALNQVQADNLRAILTAQYGVQIIDTPLTTANTKLSVLFPWSPTQVGE